MNKLALVALFVGLPAAVLAQVANINRADMDNATGALISSGLQNAVGLTYFDNDERTFLVVKNGSGSGITATEISQHTSLSASRWGTVNVGNQAVTIANGETRLLGPFPSARFNTVNGTVEVSFSTVAGVSETAIRLPK